MSVVSAENLTKTYGEKTLFDNISFVITEKQRIGLIGVNGTGKSTLLKIIAGMEVPDRGSIIHANRFYVEYLPQYPKLDDNLTVFEQIYFSSSPLMKVLREYERAALELTADPGDDGKQNNFLKMQRQMDQQEAWEANTAAKTVLTKLGINNFLQPVRELSGGQKKRVAMAKALIEPADLLILDEPTNHLDNDTIEWLEGFLGRYPGALLLVTHDRYFLNRVTNRILELDQGRLFSYEGNYEAFLAGKAAREEQEMAGEQKRQNLLRRELEWLRRGARARSTKQKARILRIEAIQGKKAKNDGGNLEIMVPSRRLGKKVLELKGVCKRYGGKRLIQDFSYLLEPGERLGIIGKNGTGKTTLLNIMAGVLEPDQGSADVGPTVKIGYYTQDYVDMDPAVRVIDYIREVSENVRTADGRWLSAEQMLERFLFSRAAQWTRIGKLSGGERRRLYLLKILVEEPNVLLLDEPTNDLDTQTLSVLENYLDQFAGTVAAVSHDRFFLDRVAEQLLVFEGDGRLRIFTGSYTEYLQEEKKQKAEKSDDKKRADHKKGDEAASGQPKRKLSYREQREWEVIEEKIADLERRNTLLQKEIAETGSDYQKAQQFFKEQQQVERELEQAVERWAELSLLVEELQKKKL